MSLIKEFKEFISRGNVVDMAVGVVIGSAFTSIVTSLANDIFTPFISFIIGKIDISKLSITVNNDFMIPYGKFLQAIVNFLLTAIAVFMLVKIINTIQARMEKFSNKTQDEVPEPEPEISSEEKLLTEIRDLLKENKNN